jgi:hypothetical protein
MRAYGVLQPVREAFGLSAGAVDLWKPVSAKPSTGHIGRWQHDTSAASFLALELDVIAR